MTVQERSLVSYPKAVVFDWDNTLVDSFQVIFDALNATFEKYGVPLWSYEKFQETLGPSVRDSFPELFGDKWEEAGAFFYKSFETRHLTELRQLPGAEAIVTLFATRETPMAVVSNKTGPYLRDEIAHLGWSAHFPAVVGALDAERDKPHAAPVDLALSQIGVPAGPDVWLIGDSKTDLQTAKAANCRAILVRNEIPRDEEFADCPPFAHFSSLTELCAYLEELPVPNGSK